MAVILLILDRIFKIADSPVNLRKALIRDPNTPHTLHYLVEH